MAKFKTSARALDLLGRQQIAGIPTAINELFKNAHDAYADNVDVDYFRKEKLLVIRDNGLGMTRNDFESRWLTLGTDSKFENTKNPMPPIDPKKDKRPVMGEKGIGRLAIASIGNQLLVLTKAKNNNVSEKIVGAFINWKIFEMPGLALEDIVIPIREFDNLPTMEEVELMKDEILESLDNLTERDLLSNERSAELREVITQFRISPIDLSEKLLGEFSLSGDSYGTHFYISPTDDSLNFDIDGERDKTASTKIEKMLLGFTNTMTPGHPSPKIVPAFRDYNGSEGTYADIFNKDNFFTPEDFLIADHHFSGYFDEYGQFSGKVNIYQTEEFEHKIPWAGNHYRKTDCGAFKINVAYLQGELRQSIIDSENHTRLIAKTNKHGGLYLYKDNIRILPYGNSDYDWLDIERNRTKSASYYFFSFRRMFGVIDISRNHNNNLTEKAGREGFIENKAYRQFRDILKNFFVQLAADFFREGSTAGPKAEIWVKKREQRKLYYQALERRDKQAKARKDKFQSSLNQFFDNISEGAFEKELNDLLGKISKDFEAVAQIDDPEEASQSLIDSEMRSREMISNFSNRIKLSQPKGFTISKETRKDYEAYLTEYERLQNGIVRNAANRIDDIVEDYSNRLQIEISKRKRLEQAVDFISEQAEKATRQKQKETKEALAEVTKNVSSLARELMIDLENKIRDIKDGFKSLEISSSGDFDLVVERKRIEDEILRERDRAAFALESIIKQLQGIYWEKGNEGVITSDLVNDAISEELEELRERVHADIELSQLGLAVGVIHHEFNSTVNSIRSSLKDLKAWADVNDKLEGVYNNIRINFEHLDGYLTLFTPLNRRLYRNKEEFASNELKIFLMDLFGARLKRHGIQLKHTTGFKNRKLFGFRSTFYPVFVNIIDNAIHWLNQSHIEEEKIVRLHADDTGFYISNNGPAIPFRDAERIFDLGFTRKLNGRGMGLHISKEVLAAEDYKIFLDEPRDGSTVTFKIETNANE